MLYADEASIVSRSRNSLANMMANIVAVCSSFGQEVTFVSEAAGQVYIQTAKFVYTLGKMLTLPSRSTGEWCWPTYVSGGVDCHCTTSSTHR